jgi:hypothetical protein
LWTRKFGSDRDTAAYGVAADSSGVYVTGEGGALDPADAPLLGAGTFVRKYDHSGQLLWTRQITTGLGSANGIAVDDGRVYVIGASREGNALRSYRSDGAEGWSTPIGPSSDFDSALAADSSGVYLAHNGFLTSYSLDGGQRWQTKYADAGARIVLTSSGIYVTGQGWKPLPGRCVYGCGDVIVRKYDRDGHVLWTRVFGGISCEAGSGLAVSDDSVYVSGWLQRLSPGPSAFFAKLDENTSPADGVPRILWDCIANAGSYQASVIAPGEIVVIMGSSIGPPQPAPLRIENGRLATSLDDTRVLFNGIAAPVILRFGQADQRDRSRGGCFRILGKRSGRISRGPFKRSYSARSRRPSGNIYRRRFGAWGGGGAERGRLGQFACEPGTSRLGYFPFPHRSRADSPAAR